MLLNGKNTSVFVTAFKAFTEIDGKTWETLDISHFTRDSSIVHEKIDYLVAVME